MQLQFTTPEGQTLAPIFDTLIVAGWAGRDHAAIEHHIEELAALGIPRPSAVPLYYRIASNQLSQSSTLQVLGPDSSGEAEVFVFSHGGEMFVSLASDHTDRKLEAYSVAFSKQACIKPVATQAWRFADVAGHWDELILRSWIVEDGCEVLYQEGTLASLRAPGPDRGLHRRPEPAARRQRHDLRHHGGHRRHTPCHAVRHGAVRPAQPAQHPPPLPQRAAGHRRLNTELPMTSVSPRLDQVSERLAQGQTSAVQLAEQALERATQGEARACSPACCASRLWPKPAPAMRCARPAWRARPWKACPSRSRICSTSRATPRWAAPDCWPMPHPPRKRPKSCSACAARARSSWARPI
jgi:hypothetical protein